MREKEISRPKLLSTPKFFPSVTHFDLSHNQFNLIMEKRLFFDLEACYPNRVVSEQVTLRKSNLHIPHTSTFAFRDAAGNEATLQEFDGFFCYINLLHTYGTAQVSIPLRVEKPDLHVFYMLGTKGNLRLIDMNSKQEFLLSPKRGCYIYLPEGNYVLQVPKGQVQLFCFYFRARIFRNNNERNFKFLHPLIQALRHKSPLPIQSIDFKIGPRTLVLIQRLLSCLKEGDLESELHIQVQVFELLKLTKEKIFEEYEKIYGGTVLAQHILDEIKKGIQQDGQKFQLQELCPLFNKSLQYLGRVYKMAFKHSLAQCRSALLLELAKETLLRQPSVTAAAYTCGFNNVQHFATFFKKHCGMKPSAYLHEVKNK